MEGSGPVIVFIGLVVLVASLISFNRPLPYLGLDSRTRSLIGVGLSLLMIGVAGSSLMPSKPPAATVAAGAATAQSTVELARATSTTIAQEEEKYRTFLIQSSERMATALSGVSTMFRSGQQVDDGWLKTGKPDLDVLQSEYEKARGVQPPAKYLGVHEKYLSALEQFSVGIAGFQSGIQTKDQQLTNGSVQRLQKAIVDMETAMKDFRTLEEQSR
jgi:hypothetical protein